MRPSASSAYTHTNPLPRSTLGSGSGYASSPSSLYVANSSNALTENGSGSNASLSSYPYVDVDHASFKSSSRGRDLHTAYGPSHHSGASFATWGEGVPSSNSSAYLHSASPCLSSVSTGSTSSPYTPSTPTTASSPLYLFRSPSHLSRSSPNPPYAIHPVLSSPLSSGLSLDLLRPQSSGLPLPVSTPATSPPKPRLILRLTRISPDLFLLVESHSSRSSPVTISDILTSLSTFLLSPLSHGSELARLPPASQRIGSETFHARTAGDARSYKRGMVWGDCIERGRSRLGGLVFLGHLDNKEEGVWEVLFA
ncbi:hypothetical protein K435DRAFT_101575 [Dendrothele bispora CBS 962.96]|uniref:DUF6699 domain-containing protein n=1 Tax=Dendrothele bispora (strain CBS 962.96) TaxID=1314807 RepID=A0A4S8M3B5_DENBC|nr:hypothetical protein K435DRAFT_101575 [Dendrothele bispora CBS 962.96]